MTLAEIAELLGASLQGDANRQITGLATLGSANEQSIAFFVNPRYLTDLKKTRAGAVLISAENVSHAPCDALVCQNPYHAFAELTAHFVSVPTVANGIHPSAFVASSAVLGSGVVVAANASIGDNVVIGDNTIIHSGVVVEANTSLGSDCRIYSNVSIYHGVKIGDRVTLHSGVVIGADGFGFAPSANGWKKIHQLGGVRVGNDVEVGANTTIDRGALDDTIIGNGVIIDNQVQIAHNVVIGDNTAIAGCTGIAGSTHIGSRCTIAGRVSIIGHLTIADGIHITAGTLVSKSLNTVDSYSSGTPLEKTVDWKKNAVRYSQLDKIARRLSALEKKIKD